MNRWLDCLKCLLLEAVARLVYKESSATAADTQTVELSARRASAVEWSPPYPHCSERACVCVSTAQDGLGEKVPRLRPLNFTSGCCLAGSFDQMWKLRSRWRWQRPNCYGFPRSCTWICNPRVEQLSPSSSWVPAPCIITLTTSCDHPLPLNTIVQYSYLSLTVSLIL